MPKGKGTYGSKRGRQKYAVRTLKEVQQLAEYNLIRGDELHDKIRDLRMKIDKNNTKSKKFRR